MWRYVIWFDRVEVIWFQWVDWSIWLSDWGHWLIWFMWCIWCDCRYVLVLVVLAWIDVFDAIWFCEFIRFYVVWCDVVRLNCVELSGSIVCSWVSWLNCLTWLIWLISCGWGDVLIWFDMLYLSWFVCMWCDHWIWYAVRWVDWVELIWVYWCGLLIWSSCVVWLVWVDLIYVLSWGVLSWVDCVCELIWFGWIRCDVSWLNLSDFIDWVDCLIDVTDWL